MWASDRAQTRHACFVVGVRPNLRRAALGRTAEGGCPPRGLWQCMPSRGRGRPRHTIHNVPERGWTIAIIVRLIATRALRSKTMQPTDNRQDRNWLTSVLTDVHFWVPVAVLIGGLLLLEYIH